MIEVRWNPGAHRKCHQNIHYNSHYHYCLYSSSRNFGHPLVFLAFQGNIEHSKTTGKHGKCQLASRTIATICAAHHEIVDTFWSFLDLVTLWSSLALVGNIEDSETEGKHGVYLLKCQLAGHTSYHFCSLVIGLFLIVNIFQLAVHETKGKRRKSPASGRTIPSERFIAKFTFGHHYNLREPCMTVTTLHLLRAISCLCEFHRDTSVTPCGPCSGSSRLFLLSIIRESITNVLHVLAAASAK